MTLPRVSVVVPARNAIATIGDCLTSILAADYPASRREVVVVDNASTDATPAVVRRLGVTCVRESERGPGPARNRGVRAGGGEIVAFTDADCVVARDWLRELMAPFAADDGVLAVAGECVAYPPTTPVQRYMMVRRPCMQKAALAAARPYFATGNVAFRRSVFARVGLFDSRFITGEDQDFAWRFLAAGLTFRYAPNAIVFHRHRAGGWPFFLQQLGWAEGAALLRRHHNIPWGLRAELAEYGKLMRAVVDLGVALGSYPWRRGDAMDIHAPFYALVREIAWRIGVVSARRWLHRPACGRTRSTVPRAPGG